MACRSSRPTWEVSGIGESNGFLLPKDPTVPEVVQAIEKFFALDYTEKGVTCEIVLRLCGLSNIILRRITRNSPSFSEARQVGITAGAGVYIGMRSGTA